MAGNGIRAELERKLETIRWESFKRAILAEIEHRFDRLDSRLDCLERQNETMAAEVRRLTANRPSIR